MNFFEFSSQNGAKPEIWYVSDKMWVFWLIAGLLTATTITAWTIWQYHGFIWEYLSWNNMRAKALGQGYRKRSFDVEKSRLVQNSGDRIMN
jgi:hypothetical protein